MHTRGGAHPPALRVPYATYNSQEMASDSAHIRRLETRLREGLTKALQGVQLNGPADTRHRYPGNLNMSFAYVEGESLIMGLKVRALAQLPVGSACNHPSGSAGRMHDRCRS